MLNRSKSAPMGHMTRRTSLLKRLNFSLRLKRDPRPTFFCSYDHIGHLVLVGKDEDKKANLACKVINRLANFELYNKDEMKHMTTIRQCLKNERKGLMDAVDLNFMSDDIEEISPISYRANLAETDCILIVGDLDSLEFRNYATHVINDICTLRKSKNVPVIIVRTNTDKDIFDEYDGDQQKPIIDIDTAIIDNVHFKDYPISFKNFTTYLVKTINEFFEKEEEEKNAPDDKIYTMGY